MLTVVYVAPGRKAAEKIRTRLEEEGIMVVLREPGKKGDAARAVEIMVPESEAEEAQTVLFSILQR